MLESIGLNPEDVGQMCGNAEWSQDAMDQGEGEMANFLGFGRKRYEEEEDEEDGEGFFAKLKNWWNRIIGYPGESKYQYEEPEERHEPYSHQGYETEHAEYAEHIPEEVHEQVHKIFEYELHKEMHHLYLHIHKKAVMIKLIKHHLMELAQTMRQFDDFIHASVQVYEETGSLADKKNAMLASLENHEHQVKFSFLLGLKKILKNALHEDLQIAQKYQQLLD